MLRDHSGICPPVPNKAIIPCGHSFDPGTEAIHILSRPKAVVARFLYIFQDKFELTSALLEINSFMLKHTKNRRTAYR